MSDTRNVVTPCLRPLGRLTVRHAVGGMGRDDGRSEGHLVMGWIRVESLRLNITRLVRELTSIGCFVARKLVEPILGGKANEATLCEPCALHRMGFGCQCVSQRWLEFSVTGSLLCRGRPLKGLSRVMGDYHARFLGGLGPVMAPGYPVCDNIWFYVMVSLSNCHEKS